MQERIPAERHFSTRAIRLYTALLAAGETEISGNLLKATMRAAASVARLSRGDGCLLEATHAEERDLCEELLKKSLFWICQVPDSVAQVHGGEIFRETLRLLLWVRAPAQTELVALERPGTGGRSNETPVPAINCGQISLRG